MTSQEKTCKGTKTTMERLDLRIIKKRIQELKKRNAADLEQATNLARLRYDYHQSRLDDLVKLCDCSLKLHENGRLDPKLEPKFEPEWS